MAEQADLILHGGDIVTLAEHRDDERGEAVAVAVKDGTVVFVGPEQEALERWRGPNTVVRDLGGRALLPGFIDAHGHLGGIGLQTVIANLLADPDGDVTDLASLKDKLRSWAADPVGADSEWIIGFGYDDAMLAEGRHPTRDDLDEVSTDRPVLAIHQSFHLGAVNSLGLKRLRYSATTPDPEGGVIRRRELAVPPSYGEPDGVLEEKAFTPASDLALAGLPERELLMLFATGAATAASFGFTTVQEGGTTLANLKALRDTAAAVRFPVDVVAYVKAEEAMSSALDDPIGVSDTYVNGVRAAGVKLVLDGSPQGRTAWLGQPYLTPPPGKPQGYCGYPAVPDGAVVAKQVGTAVERGWQVLAHVNGDAAIDQFLTAVAAAGAGRRPTVAIHAQTAREDQIDAFARLGILPSFFSMHTYYWGDWYRETVLGEQRAQDISPARWALDRSLRYTSHHDAPVALPNSIAVLSSQVTRRTRSGHLLGPDQRVSALDAVRAITINAAHQYGEQDRKGSIEVGKLADLVVLSENPLTVDPERIRDIEVIETIKAGATVHPPAPTGRAGGTPSTAPAPHWGCSC
ncbi:amidohydrolase [Kitasatospora purpeofusca]|uniref:amidohydrolase n=1 Tax=Kitasatospora purpeofusca TaxID=67352 RepID=UPI0035D67EB8